MTEKEQLPEFQKIDPDDYSTYEEGFIKKGGGGGSGGKGKKTLKALKREQRNLSFAKRKLEVENSLIRVLKGFPQADNRDLEDKQLDRYLNWIAANYPELSSPDPSEIDMTFSKSGGPGGQNVNKRETKVSLIHLPTHLRAESDLARSQLQNKDLALELLQERLQSHINDWKQYLAPNQNVDLELVQYLLKKLDYENPDIKKGLFR